MLLVVDQKERKEKAIQSVFHLQKQEQCQKAKEDLQFKEKEQQEIQDQNLKCSYVYKEKKSC